MGLRKSRRHSGTGNGVQSRGRSPFPGSHSDFHNVPANIHTPFNLATHRQLIPRLSSNGRASIWSASEKFGWREALILCSTFFDL
jgi:hypothetical protein